MCVTALCVRDEVTPEKYLPLECRRSPFIAAAGLSFLGLGLPTYEPSWGNIMGLGRSYLQAAVWVTFFPGLFLTATVLAVNMVGDSLRDVLDPRMRGAES